MEKSPFPVTGSLANDWKERTASARAEVKVPPNDTDRWLSSIPAVNSCTQVPDDPTDSVCALIPDFVPGPKLPLATPSAMPIVYWTA